MADVNCIGIQEILDAWKAVAPLKSKKEKVIKVFRSYEFQESMMFAIQALTGQQTHEIMTVLVEEADKHINDSDIDITIPPKDNAPINGYGYDYSHERRLRKYMFYPGTKLYMGLYLLYDDYDMVDGSDGKLKYNFKLPTASLKLNEQEFNDYITDGILCDSSKDIDSPIMKGTLTKEERGVKELQRKQKQKENAAKKRLARQKANNKP